MAGADGWRGRRERQTERRLQPGEPASSCWVAPALGRAGRGCWRAAGEPARAPGPCGARARAPALRRRQQIAGAGCPRQRTCGVADFAGPAVGGAYAHGDVVASREVGRVPCLEDILLPCIPGRSVAVVAAVIVLEVAATTAAAAAAPAAAPPPPPAVRARAARREGCRRAAGRAFWCSRPAGRRGRPPPCTGRGG